MYNRVKNPNYGYNSSLGVLPPLAKSDVIFSQADDATKYAIEIISKHLNWYISNNESRWFGIWPGRWYEFELSFEQAKNVIQHLNAKFKFIGSLHLPTLNTILFQTDFGNFSIKYGPQSGCYVLYFKFDIDHGFTPSDRVMPQDETDNLQNIVTMLQKYFDAWCKNNKKGFVISDDAQHSTLAVKQTKTSYWQYGKYVGVGAVLLGMGIFAFQQGNDSAVAEVVDALTPKI